MNEQTIQSALAIAYLAVTAAAVFFVRKARKASARRVVQRVAVTGSELVQLEKLRRRNRNQKKAKRRKRR